MNNKAQFGYEWKDGELVVNYKESAIVKWIYKNVLEYSENPPNYLIKETMKESQEELSYDEAKEKVSFSKVQIYVAAELNVRLKECKDRQADGAEIQRLLESKLNNKLIVEVNKEYRLQKEIAKGSIHFGGYIPSHNVGHYVGKVVQGLPSGFEKLVHEPLIPKELYESAVKKIQESQKHTPEEEQGDNWRQDKFFERMDALLPLVDLYKLDESCNSSDDSYAKEILKQLHDIFVDVYGTDNLENSNHEFVVIPAVIKARKTGHIGLGIVELDLESSGEHWRTYFLTPRGVIERHKEETYNDNYNYIMDTYIPYDYWYTATVEGDIHVDFENVPEKISGMLDACYPDQHEMKME